jgi:hypothetical protein
MEAGIALGGTSILIHVIEKSIMILRHFHLLSKCCGQHILDIHIDSGTPPNEKKLLAIGSPKTTTHS